MSKPIEVPELFDEPVASVLRGMQLRGGETDIFEGDSLPQMGHRVYGGQVLGQSVMAAAATLDEYPDRQLVSLHANFLRGADTNIPLEFHCERLRDGRSFSNRLIRCVQGEKSTYIATLSFQEKQPGLEHQEQMPPAPAPEDLPGALELFRNIDHPVAKFLGKTAAFDVRHVDGNLYMTPAKSHDPAQQLWLRIRANVPSGTDQIVHRSLLAYVVDQFMMEPALRAHGLCWRTPGLVLASLDHAMWFHRDVNINDWLFFDQNSDGSGGSRALGRTRIFDRAGKLIATAQQQCMIRLPQPESKEAHSKWGFEIPPVP